MIWINVTFIHIHEKLNFELFMNISAVVGHVIIYRGSLFTLYDNVTGDYKASAKQLRKDLSPGKTFRVFIASV